MSGGLSKRRVQADAHGNLSLPDLDRILDDVDRILRDHDRRIEEGGSDHSTNVTAIASITRVVGGNGGGAAVVSAQRQQVFRACVANQSTYALGFFPNPAQVIMAWVRGLAMTPSVDYTIAGSDIILEPDQVPLNSEGYIIVEGTPL